MGGGSGHQMSPDGARNKAVAERNSSAHEEHKQVRDCIVGEGQGFSEEDEPRINESAVDRNDGREAAVAAAALQAGLQKQQQLLPGPVVMWEKILPVRTLKVLLVESDDSTRQVVSALLRNCSYEGKRFSYLGFTYCFFISVLIYFYPETLIYHLLHKALDICFFNYTKSLIISFCCSDFSCTC